MILIFGLYSESCILNWVTKATLWVSKSICQGLLQNIEKKTKSNQQTQRVSNIETQLLVDSDESNVCRTMIM